MPTESRAAIVAELRQAFGEARDVTPGPDQPLHVLLPRLPLLPPWRPSKIRALLRFGSWPAGRPDFFIEPVVVNAQGAPPRNPYDHYILGETWRSFSFQFAWPAGDGSATQAVLQWLNRFRLDL
jgi:hypothetical protein